MDAANPLCRWLLAAGLFTAFGCHSDGADLKTRGQIPSEPIAPPLAPTRPVAPTPPASPVVTAGPTVPGTGVKTIEYSTPNVARGDQLLKDGVPQIKIAAHVGTNVVTDQEVVEAVRQRLGELNALQGEAQEAKERQMYAAELRHIIERELILEEMYTKLKAAGRLKTIDDIKEYAGRSADQNLKAYRKQYPQATEEDFLTILRAQGLTLPVIRRQIERQLMADEYVRSVGREKGRIPGLADIRDYYDRHPDEFKTPDRVKWLDIFISFNQHATTPAAFAHAETVRKKAAAGGDFVALVKQYDNGLAVGTNGVGVGSKRGEIQPADVEPTVWALKPGEVSRLVETPTGYHIVKVAEREYAGVRAYDAKLQTEIRDKLTMKYREAEYQKMIEELWRKGAVRVIENP